MINIHSVENVKTGQSTFIFSKTHDEAVAWCVNNGMLITRTFDACNVPQEPLLWYISIMQMQVDLDGIAKGTPLWGQLH